MTETLFKFSSQDVGYVKVTFLKLNMYLCQYNSSVLLCWGGGKSTKPASKFFPSRLPPCPSVLSVFFLPRPPPTFPHPLRVRLQGPLQVAASAARGLLSTGRHGGSPRQREDRGPLRRLGGGRRRGRTGPHPRICHCGDPGARSEGTLPEMSGTLLTRCTARTAQSTVI